ncbi:unnamed protein product, partial [Musa acuminata subsp. burmannicoides]
AYTVELESLILRLEEENAINLLRRVDFLDEKTKRRESLLGIIRGMRVTKSGIF